MRQIYLNGGLRVGAARPASLPFPATVTRRPPIVVALAACLLVAAGCGGGDSNGTAETTPPTAKPEQFPSASGKTLAQLRQSLPQGGPVLAPSVSDFVVGQNRVGFGLFTTSRAQIANAQAVVYVAPLGGGPATGPYPAKYESLAVKPQFQSQTSAKDPDSAKSVYVAQVPFPKSGKYEILGMARLDNRLVAAQSAMPEIDVPKQDPVPGPGDKAPFVHTPTVESVGGDIGSIDTRTPHDDMHNVDFADVVGKKPVVLVFATPLLCQSRVCGPVVDIAEEVKQQYGDRADFIHMEIYNDNQVNKGFRPQVAAWRLPSEPWVFAIDKNGKIVARLEGAFGADELEQAVNKALKG
jgi:hypothetical protein